MPLTRKQIWRKLTRLFARVEGSNNRFDVDYREPQFLGGRRRSSVVSIAEVWVFGSFARGAKDCGDLDLIVYLTLHEGMVPTEAALRRVVIGGLRDTDVLFGWVHRERRYEQDPDLNDARRIWTPDAPQWKRFLDRIQVSDSAARHPRKTDALPFSLKRACLARDEAEEIVDGIEARRLTSTFHDLVDTSDYDWRESVWARGHLSDAGRDRQKLLPTIFRGS